MASADEKFSPLRHDIIIHVYVASADEKFSPLRYDIIIHVYVLRLYIHHMLQECLPFCHSFYLVIVLSAVQFMTSDYPDDIFKLFMHKTSSMFVCDVI